MPIEINQDRLLHALFFTPMGEHPTARDIDGNPEEDWGARAILLADPGGGKTRAQERLARRMNACFYTLKPGARGEGAYGVTPVPQPSSINHDRMILGYPGPDWVERFWQAEQGGQAGLLNVDELNTAPPAYQAAQMGLLQDKEIGAEVLPPRCRIMGTMNPSGEHTWDLSPAVKNRVFWIPWEDASVDAWCDWLLNGAKRAEATPINAREEEARVLKAWPAAWAYASGMMAAFSRAKLDMHRVMPTDNSDFYAWVSPRSKEYATRALASARIHDLSSEETYLFIAGAVGTTFASEWAAYRRKQDLPDVQSFLKGEVKFEHNPNRLDRTAALLSACMAVFTGGLLEDEKAAASELYKFIGGLPDSATDVTARIITNVLYGRDLVVGVPNSGPVIERVAAHLRAESEIKGL